MFLINNNKKLLMYRYVQIEISSYKDDAYVHIAKIPLLKI